MPKVVGLHERRADKIEAFVVRRLWVSQRVCRRHQDSTDKTWRSDPLFARTVGGRNSEGDRHRLVARTKRFVGIGPEVLDRRPVDPQDEGGPDIAESRTAPVRSSQGVPVSLPSCHMDQADCIEMASDIQTGSVGEGMGQD